MCLPTTSVTPHKDSADFRAGRQFGEAAYPTPDSTTPRKARQVEASELREATERLAAALSDTGEEEIVTEFNQAQRRGKAASL